MTKSTQFLRNTATKKIPLTALPKNFSLLKKLTFFVCLSLIICGCTASNQTKNFYSREEIPRVIEKISKEEFNLDVKASLTRNSLWVYLPQEKLLDSKFNFLEDAALNLDHASLVIGRVILNTPDPPQFYVLVASDIKSIGLDYIIISYSKDLKRYYYSRISRGEFAKRRISQVKLNILALDDTKGAHLAPQDIDIHIFLAEQIKKRIEDKLKEEPLKQIISVKSVNADFKDNRFIFNLDFSKINPAATIDASKEAQKIAATVLKDYDLKDFEAVSINEVVTGKNITLSQKALFESFK